MVNKIRLPVTIQDFTGDPSLVTAAVGTFSRRTDATPVSRFFMKIQGSPGAGIDLGAFAYAFFEVESSAIAIRVNPSDYAPTQTVVGEEDVIQGAIAPTVAFSREQYGFSLNSRAGFYFLPMILLQLRKNARANPATRAAVTVWDGLNVRPADLAQGYTVRQMAITAVSPNGGSRIVDNEQWLPGGWSAQFTELDADGVAPQGFEPAWSAGLWG